MMGTTMATPVSQQLETLIRGLPMSVTPGTPIGDVILDVTGITDCGALIGALVALDQTGALTGTPNDVF